MTVTRRPRAMRMLGGVVEAARMPTRAGDMAAAALYR